MKKGYFESGDDVAVCEVVHYSDDELQDFKSIIISKIKKAKQNIALLKGSNYNENGTDDTSPTFKVLEEGQATLSNEQLGKTVQNQRKFIGYLESALIRIENKTFGVCKKCQKLISKGRLTAVPHTPLCMDCKD